MNALEGANSQFMVTNQQKVFNFIEEDSEEDSVTEDNEKKDDDSDY